ncbi:MAG TPA: 2-oxoglutarate and iron-dependent oxygenase domain-containing protein, partial [Flavisolibacter sp.]|nr:2-oxoglutarate and iron-dependent oxygenase domain-containing protein [Flavisolibacter sp.]
MLQGNEASSASQQQTAMQIAQACKTAGFFYITGHGVSEELQKELEDTAHAFFARPEEEKMRLAMSKGGKAWRGYFPVEGELTSGKPDLKEGLYFGQELPNEDPRVNAGLPLHGRNLFPDDPPGFRTVVLSYLSATEQMAHAVMRGIALSLNLPANYFYTRYTSDPLILFRIFHYPPQKNFVNQQWGVGEHTDYG